MGYLGNVNSNDVSHSKKQQKKSARLRNKIRNEKFTKRSKRKKNQEKQRLANISRNLRILDPSVSTILNLGSSNGRPLGFYLPPGTAPINIGLTRNNQVLYRNFVDIDPRQNTKVQKIHLNDLDSLQRKHKHLPNNEFYRFLKFTNQKPSAVTRLYNNTKVNITPINGVFGGTLALPTYTRYHATPSNALIRQVRPTGFRALSGRSYYIPTEKFKALQQKSRPISTRNFYGQTNPWYTQNMRNMRNYTSEMIWNKSGLVF